MNVKLLQDINKLHKTTSVNRSIFIIRYVTTHCKFANANDDFIEIDGNDVNAFYALNYSSNQ